MHKNIVKSIEFAISQRDESYKDLLRIFIQTKETSGFWQMCIITKKDYEHLIPHLEDIGKSIGRFYGEGLGVEKGTNYIIFS
jgi:hypothetical protein